MKPRASDSASSRELKVCPTLSDDQYVITISRLSNSLLRGCMGSVFLDRGENFVQTRAYQNGDATGTIDWKASARSNGLVVKEHESMRQTVVTLMVDRSGSMTAGCANTSKYAAASVLCGGLALAALKTGNPVAMLLSDVAGRPPSTLSSSRLTASLVAMRRYQVRENTPFSFCMSEGFALTHQRQLIFILSDFHDECVQTQIAAMATRHEVILIRLRDGAELHTPRGGTIAMRPAEGGSIRYARAQRPRPSSADDIISALGLPTVTIDPLQPVSRQLSHFLALRNLLC